MPKITKKEKTVKLGEIEKITEYLKTFDTIAVVENIDFQNTCIQSLRTSIEGKIIFSKKSLLQRYYPSLCFDKNYFLIFTNGSEIEKIKSFNFLTFLEAGDLVSEDIVIPAGLIKNQKLHTYLKPLDIKGANTYLTADFKVVEAGNEIDEKAATILKIKGERLVHKPIKIIEILETKNIKQI